MVTFLFILMGLCILGMLCCVSMLFRNQWVLKVRLAAISKADGSYDKLPSYSYMFYKFWIFDVNKF